MKGIQGVAFLSGVLCFISGAHAGVVLSDLPGTGTYLSTSIFLSPVNWAAVGFKTSAASEDFVSFRGIFTSFGGGLLEGGIFSDNSGNPGSLLAAFSNVTIPGSATASYTTQTTSTYTLAPLTHYWVVLHDAVPYAWARDNSGTSGTAPLASAGYSFDGYRTSSNSGSAWTTLSGTNLTVEITTAATPEPGSLGLLAAGAVMMLRRRRK